MFSERAIRLLQDLKFNSIIFLIFRRAIIEKNYEKQKITDSKHNILKLPAVSFIKLRTQSCAASGRQLINTSTWARLFVDNISRSFLIRWDDCCFSRTSPCLEVMQPLAWSSLISLWSGSNNSDNDCQLDTNLFRCFLSSVCISGEK